ncbi:MAG TPA: hypothetical protein VIM33_12880 [Gaiellaceae bacterium]|jgi:hypothetical protein
MNRVAPIALVLLAATAFAAAAAGRDASGPTASRCGGELWRLKTLSDSARQAVVLNPTGTTIAAIGERPFPRPLPRLRQTAFQKHAWQVVAQITKYRVESDGVRLELYDHESYLNAVIPTPDCLSNATRARSDMAAAFKLFTGRCGHPATSGWQSLGAIVYVRGVGFWSQRRSLRGAARNGAELHPVTGLRIVAGC